VDNDFFMPNGGFYAQILHTFLYKCQQKAVYNRKRQMPGEASAFLTQGKSPYSHSMDAGGLVLTS